MNSRPMPHRFPANLTVPSAAQPALAVLRNLRDAGHVALLAGGCVRDLLLGDQPHDYDVVTDAVPQRVAELFRSTRLVGAQFGVVLVKRRRVWVEVATFRSEGAYLDGRRPSEVHFGDARADAFRRDFTVNGMFLDPLAGEVIDYVDGRADLAARRIRAIGDPPTRFGEDYLRLLRAVRFAARLEFAIEPTTWNAMRRHADRLAQVAAERVLDELSRMYAHPRRKLAFELLAEAGLLPHLWPDARWSADAIGRAAERLGALPADAPFTLAFAAVLAEHDPREIHEICRALACSNEQRETIAWLVAQQAALDDADTLELAALKRLMAHPAFDQLERQTRSRFSLRPAGAARAAALTKRLAAIPPESVAPPPLLTGADLADLGVEPGPIYKQVLDAAYTAQLNELLPDRPAAIDLARRLLDRQA